MTLSVPGHEKFSLNLGASSTIEEPDTFPVDFTAMTNNSKSSTIVVAGTVCVSKKSYDIHRQLGYSKMTPLL